MQTAASPKAHVHSQPPARRAGAPASASPQAEHAAQFAALAESSPQHMQQGVMAARINASPRLSLQRKIAANIHDGPRQAAQGRMIDGIEASSLALAQKKTIQRIEEKDPLDTAAKPNHTGLPDNLKSGIENLSGMSMDHVKVHYNSSQPAQLNALAYAQGSDIHVAPGQEQHVPHEAWHVVQQAQGRVQPTTQMKLGVPVNDDVGLEAEADAMGAKALAGGAAQRAPSSTVAASTGPIQRKWVDIGRNTLLWDRFIEGARWYFETDSDKMFYVFSGFTSEKKDREEWVKEYGSDPLADLDGSMIPLDEVAQPLDMDMGQAGSLMEQLENRYITKPTWDDGSGPDPSQKKLVIIESFVKKDDGSSQSVYKNEMDVTTNKFYAAWNQRTTDTEVGSKKSKAMFNSDLLTCHRQMAIAFAKAEGAEVNDDKDKMTIVRKNVNNGEWQIINSALPVSMRIKLTGAKVTESSPLPFKDMFSYTGSDDKTHTAASMWEIFKTKVPNTKAVFAMVEQRYPGYAISSWEFGSGNLTATVEKLK